jgi:uncharacterized protein
MASSLLVLVDDIATILDDVSVMTKIAAKKTAGVLGDDLALNAQQVSGVNADRELPVVWAVAKGSAINKAILVPVALAINIFLPAWVTIALLMIGGAYLCFEGFEKVAHKFLHSKDEDAIHHEQQLARNTDTSVDMVQMEKDKIKGAVRTDFILSAEIIVISLGTLAAASITQKITVLVGISILMTIGVYGLVAGIVKLDDLGLLLIKKTNAAAQAIGRGILAFAPKLMKTLSVVGTIAMFLVGGSIISHGIPAIHHVVEALTKSAAPMLGQGFAGFLVPTVTDGLVGLIVGALCVAVVMVVSKLRKGPTTHH